MKALRTTRSKRKYAPRVRVFLNTGGWTRMWFSYFCPAKTARARTRRTTMVFIGTDEGGCPRHAHLRSTN